MVLIIKESNGGNVLQEFNGPFYSRTPVGTMSLIIKESKGGNVLKESSELAMSLRNSMVLFIQGILCHITDAMSNGWEEG